MYVCLCADVTIDELKECTKQNNGDIESVVNELQVTQGCGSCTYEVLNIINNTNITKLKLNGD